MDQSFDDKANVRGLVKVMNSQKVTKAAHYEQRFMNEQKLEEYDLAVRDVEQRLRELEQTALQIEDSVRTAPVEQSSISPSSRASFPTTRASMVPVDAPSMQSSRLSNQSMSIPSHLDQMQDRFLARINATRPESASFGGQCDTEELLEDIQELVESLKAEGISAAVMPQFHHGMSSAQLRQVKHALMKKWKRVYSQGIVEDVILLGVRGVEKVFNGSTTVLGLTPNLQGFGNSVMMSVKQHRQEISRVIDRGCEEYGIGSKEKFLAKIVTSAVKRNLMNKSHNNTDSHASNLKAIRQGR